MSREIDVQDHVADFYVEKRYKGYGLKYHTHVIKQMMGGINGRILDVGCGTGIINDLYPKLDIIGIDISPGMLKHHKGKNRLASANQIPFEDNYFDSVVCRSLLHHLPDCDKGLSEIKRVLKPGGKFVCWETNKSWLAELVRSKTQHGDHFSEYHTSFSDLRTLVSKYLKIGDCKYGGFLAYPLLGFPDIVDFSKFSGIISDPLIWIDEFISNIPFINRLGFYVMIKAIK